MSFNEALPIQVGKRRRPARDVGRATCFNEALPIQVGKPVNNPTIQIPANGFNEALPIQVGKQTSGEATASGTVQLQ